MKGWSLILGVDDEDRIISVLTTLNTHITTLPNTFDVAIITALPHVEYEALMQLPIGWKSIKKSMMIIFITRKKLPPRVVAKKV